MRISIDTIGKNKNGYQASRDKKPRKLILHTVATAD